MYKNKKILGVITARGGSKGIPRKNIKNLSGRPLIFYTIDAAQKSALLTRCIVSTDDKEIADISRSFGADVPFMRPERLSRDESLSMHVAQHVLNDLEDGETYDYLMILQPTSPLRTSEDIDASIKIAVDNGADSVMSMVELTDFAPEKIKRIQNNVIHPYFEDEGKDSKRRQDIDVMYKRNCAIYLTHTKCIKEGNLFGDTSLSYRMPQERSIDINDGADFQLVEFLMSKSK